MRTRVLPWPIALCLMTIGALVAPMASGAHSEAKSGSRPTFDGRLLFVGQKERQGRFVVLELRSGSRKPEQIASLDATEDEQATDWDEQAFALSADGRWTATPWGVLHDLEAGTSVPLPGDEEDPSHRIRLDSAAFSPDGTKLAYTRARLPSEDVVGAKAVVYDLATGAATVVLAGASQRYAPTGAVSGGVECSGQVEDVAWLDAVTLVVWHRAKGTMPDSVTYGEDGCAHPPANTYSVVTIDGQALGSAPGSEGAIVAVEGATVLLESGRWVDAAELRSTTEEMEDLADPLPDAILPCLSPDGETVVQQGPPWRLVDVPSGTKTRLATRVDLAPGSPPCAWSPDGELVALVPYDNLFQVILIPGTEADADTTEHWVRRRSTRLSSFSTRFLAWVD